jgi:hypothetical protein
VHKLVLVSWSSGSFIAKQEGEDLASWFFNFLCTSLFYSVTTPKEKLKVFPLLFSLYTSVPNIGTSNLGETKSRGGSQSSNADKPSMTALSVFKVSTL